MVKLGIQSHTNLQLFSSQTTQNHNWRGGQDQENMDKAADRVGADKAQEPQNEQYGCDCYKHI